MASMTALGRGVSVSQTALWQTNSVLVEGDGGSLLVDPGFEPAEIVELGARVRARGDTTVLVTHADFDHTCGIGLLPDATVVAGDDTAAVIRSGAAAEQLRAAGAEWGLDWPDVLRVDREISAGEHEIGPWRVVALPVAGHTADGLAFVLPDHGVLVAGDYLSAITYPFVGAGVARTAEACRVLRDALGELDVEWVVPGHGPVLTTADARRIADEDASYLDRLLGAASEARERTLAPGPALVHVFAVDPPRETTLDFDVYGIRAANARAALADG